MDRLLPSSVDIEHAVIGACILGGEDVSKDVARRLNDGEAFYSVHSRKIFGAIQACITSGVQPDVVNVVNNLDRKGDLEEVGGATVVAQLSGDIATIGNVPHHCDIIISDFNRRKLIFNLKGVIDRAYEKDEDVEELYSIVRNTEVPVGTSDNAYKLADVVIEAADAVERAYQNPSDMSGIPTGIHFLDKLLGGWQNELIIIAARPSVGKTALMLWAARHAENPVYVVSAEMNRRMIAMRLLAAEVGIPSHMLRAGRISTEEYVDFQRAESNLKRYPIYIDDRVKSPPIICAESIRLQRQKGIKAVFVDYLQRLSPPLAQSREREVAMMSDRFKTLVSDLDAPVIVLAQLNRQIEYTSRRPQKSDLRDSGAIEQDADVVIFLHPVKDTDVLEVIVDKNRNGPTGLQRIRFNKNTGAFEELM